MFWTLFIETATTIVLVVGLSWIIYKAFTRQSTMGDDN